jgi:hypothetical protein
MSHPHRHRCTDPGKTLGQHATAGAVVAAIDDPQGVEVRVIFGSLPSHAVDPASASTWVGETQAALQKRLDRPAISRIEADPLTLWVRSICAMGANG